MEEILRFASEKYSISASIEDVLRIRGDMAGEYQKKTRKLIAAGLDSGTAYDLAPTFEMLVVGALILAAAGKSTKPFEEAQRQFNVVLGRHLHSRESVAEKR